MPKPKLTVVVTYRNDEKTLQECLYRLRNQTLQNMRVLCMTGHDSADRSTEIVRNIQKADPRIDHATVSCRFVSDLRSAALDRIDSDYVWYVYGSFGLNRDVCEYLVREADRTSAEIVSFRSWAVGGDSRWSEYRPRYADRMMRPEEFVHYLREVTGCQPKPSARLYKTAFLRSDPRLTFSGISGYEEARHNIVSTGQAERILIEPKIVYEYENRAYHPVDVLGREWVVRLGEASRQIADYLRRQTKCPIPGEMVAQMYCRAAGSHVPDPADRDLYDRFVANLKSSISELDRLFIERSDRQDCNIPKLKKILFS